MGISISTIIPALNETKTLGGCISSINSIGQDVEIIVADGGSTDGTVDLAERLGAKVTHSEPCRGLQCNRGAAIANGELLVFLHADASVAPGAFERLSGIFANGDVKIGNFRIRYDTDHWLLKMLSFLSCFDVGLFRFGDQGIIVRRSLFDELGGFPEWSLFEDMEFIRKAREKAKIYRFPISLTTSARRFLQNGIIRQQMINTFYTIQYLLGKPTTSLSEKYYRRPVSSRDSLIVMLKFPEVGRVKTRLGDKIGNEEAARFYRYCAQLILTEVRNLSLNIDSYIYYTPRNKRKEVKDWVGSCFSLCAQDGGNLSTRLEKAFRKRFKAGAVKVIALATDVPDLATSDIEEAVCALDTSDLVIGPSTDGGYYLIGMTEFHEALFTSISWSTERVYGQTIAAAQRLGLNVYNLRNLDDIDTEADYRRWKGEKLSDFKETDNE